MKRYLLAFLQSKLEERTENNFVKFQIIIKKYKTFSVLIYSYINTSGIGKTRNCVETRRPQGGVFSHNFESSSVSGLMAPFHAHN